MPFWGVDFGEWTLTYILTHPFNNRLSFSPTTESWLGRASIAHLHAELGAEGLRACGLRWEMRRLSRLQSTIDIG